MQRLAMRVFNTRSSPKLLTWQWTLYARGSIHWGSTDMDTASQMFRVGALSASSAHWGRALPQHWVIVWGYYASVWHRFSEGETFAVFVPNLKCSMTANVMKNQGWAATRGMLLSLLVTTLLYLFMSFLKILITWYVDTPRPPTPQKTWKATSQTFCTSKPTNQIFFYHQLSQ